MLGGRGVEVTSCSSAPMTSAPAGAATTTGCTCTPCAGSRTCPDCACRASTAAGSRATAWCATSSTTRAPRPRVRLGIDGRADRACDGGGWASSTRPAATCSAPSWSSPRDTTATRSARLGGREAFDGELLHASRLPQRGALRRQRRAGRRLRATRAPRSPSTSSRAAPRASGSRSAPPRTSCGATSRASPTRLTGVDGAPPAAALVDPIIRSRLSASPCGDLTKYGLPSRRAGSTRASKRRRLVPIIDVGLIDSLKAGTVEPSARRRGIRRRRRLLAGGERIQPEAVIVATGYAAVLEPLVGHLGVLGARGRPARARRRRPRRAPGLYFIGF